MTTPDLARIQDVHAALDALDDASTPSPPGEGGGGVPPGCDDDHGMIIAAYLVMLLSGAFMGALITVLIIYLF